MYFEKRSFFPHDFFCVRILNWVAGHGNITYFIWFKRYSSFFQIVMNVPPRLPPVTWTRNAAIPLVHTVVLATLGTLVAGKHAQVCELGRWLLIIMFLIFIVVFSFFFFQFYISPFSFLADVNECASSTPVCGINFSCRNTLGSFRCEYKPRGSSCQGKKSMSCVFIFVMAPFNTGEKTKWNNLCTEDIFQNSIQEITKHEIFIFFYYNNQCIAINKIITWRH